MEGHPLTRRRFVTGAAAVAFTLPALGSAPDPIVRRDPFGWQVIGVPSDFTPSGYVTRLVGADRSLAFVRRRNPAIDTEPQDQYNAYVALSARCTHLGCPVAYEPASERFACACGGVYNLRGEPVDGSLGRPLDRYSTLERGGHVYVGPGHSLSSALQRFSPRVPGEPLDGLGRYLYAPAADPSIRSLAPVS